MDIEMINDNDLMSYGCTGVFATQLPSHFQFAEPTGVLLERVKVYADIDEVSPCKIAAMK
jgi:hypothetical protein